MNGGMLFRRLRTSASRAGLADPPKTGAGARGRILHPPTAQGGRLPIRVEEGGTEKRAKRLNAATATAVDASHVLTHKECATRHAPLSPNPKMNGGMLFRRLRTSASRAGLADPPKTGAGARGRILHPPGAPSPHKSDGTNETPTSQKPPRGRRQPCRTRTRRPPPPWPGPS